MAKRIKTSPEPPPEITFYFAVPIRDGCKVLRSTDGRYFMHEIGRWGFGGTFREVKASYASRLLAETYPIVADGPLANSLAVSGCIG